MAPEPVGGALTLKDQSPSSDLLGVWGFGGVGFRVEGLGFRVRENIPTYKFSCANIAKTIDLTCFHLSSKRPGSSLHHMLTAIADETQAGKQTDAPRNP